MTAGNQLCETDEAREIREAYNRANADPGFVESFGGRNSVAGEHMERMRTRSHTKEMNVIQLSCPAGVAIVDLSEVEQMQAEELRESQLQREDRALR